MQSVVAESERVKTGVPGLDEVLGGGLVRDRIFLVQGAPGTGKTTLGMQFLLEGIAAGERGLYISLSETREELRSSAASHGFELGALEIFERPDDPAGVGDQTLFHPAEVELGEMMRTLLDEVERVRPTRVVFDSLTEIRLLSQSVLRFRRQIDELKRFFVGRHCTVLLLDEDFEEVQQVQTIAHGVVCIEQLAPVFGSERRRLRVSKLRGVRYRGGYHDFRIRTGGLVVYPRLVAAEHHEAFELRPVSSGIEGLDALLHGGPDWGTTTLIMGPAGVGKSSIAVHYALAGVGRGEHGVMFLFDEGPPTLFARSKGLGLDVEAAAARGTLTIRQMDPAEVSPGEFACLVREHVEAEHARIVVIDSLNGYLNAMPEERFLAAQLHELFSYLRQRGVLTLVVVAQHGFVGAQLETPVDVSYLADTVLLVRNYEYGGRLLRALSAVKKRSGAHETTIREFSMGRHGIEVGPPLESLRGVLLGVPEAVGPSGAGGRHARSSE
jgi:circadian clock protein KaiC